MKLETTFEGVLQHLFTDVFVDVLLRGKVRILTLKTNGQRIVMSIQKLLK